FFSSRRRHTRSKRDWSSDVCSSDLQSTAYHRRACVHCFRCNAEYSRSNRSQQSKDRLVACHRIQTRSGVLQQPGVRTIPVSLPRSEEHTSELQSRFDLVCRLLLEKK